MTLLFTLMTLIDDKATIQSEVTPTAGCAQRYGVTPTYFTVMI